MPSPSQGDSFDVKELGGVGLLFGGDFFSEDGMQIFRPGSTYEPTVIDILERLLQ